MGLKINGVVSTPNGEGILIGNLRDKNSDDSRLFLVAHKPGVIKNPVSGKKFTRGEPKVWELWIYEEKEIKEK